MPRVPTPLIRHAYNINPLLLPLLHTCRDLGSAQNELRWLTEHAKAQAAQSEKTQIKSGRFVRWRDLLKRYCVERGRGKPLQYILGTEFFGDLEVGCGPGVLIPRQDTAYAVSYLAKRLFARRRRPDHKSAKLPKELRILDVCSGTGCIPFLLQNEFLKYKRDSRYEHDNREVAIKTVGVDISPMAVHIARRNNKRFSHLPETEFICADVLTSDFKLNSKLATSKIYKPGRALMDALRARNQTQWDIVISNPPYISPKAFNKDTSRSARNYEPKLALVPPELPNSPLLADEQGDIFYPALLHTANAVGAKIAFFEIADLAQAYRVAQMARRAGWDGVEIWRDIPDQVGQVREGRTIGEFIINGIGNARSIICWKAEGSGWIGKFQTMKGRRTST